MIPHGFPFELEGSQGHTVIKKIINLSDGIMLDLQKSYINSTESFHRPHHLVPSINIFYNQGTFVRAEKPTSVHCYELNSRLCLDFTTFGINIVFLFQILTQASALHLVVMSPQSPLVGDSLSVFPCFLQP